MTGPVTRKIEIARQIEEMRLLASEQGTDLPAKAKKQGISAAMVAERLQRQQAIVRTLEFCRDFEHEIRAWAKAHKEQAHKEQADAQQG